MKVPQLILIISIVLFLFAFGKATTPMLNAVTQTPTYNTFWEFQSIDTMKFSRDLAREKEHDPSYEAHIEEQIKEISKTGATHVAIGTPYDNEFIPFMKLWIKSARAHGLHVWFRGNLSGWEEWFNYKPINREEHIAGITAFITENPDLFEDGDVFTSCPECENGGPGDPRFNGDLAGHRTFLIEEYKTVKNAFKKIDKDVTANYYSMNGDVAKLVMNKETTKSLDGVITIDHYVESTDQLVEDIREYAELSGGKVVLGEWGAPIPDIHGKMTREQQAEWINRAMEKLVDEPELLGINYWTHQGSSTALWDEEGSKPRPAAQILSKFYNPPTISGTITDTKGNILTDVLMKTNKEKRVITNGTYIIPIRNTSRITFQKNGYKDIIINPNPNEKEDVIQNVTLQKENHSFIDKIWDYIYILFRSKPLSYARMNA